MELQREPQEPKVFILRLIFCRSHCWVQDRSNLIDGNDAQSKRDVLLSNQIRPEMIIFDSKWILNFENMESKPSPYKKRWQACLVRNKTDMASMLSPLYHQYGKHTWSLSWPKWQPYLVHTYIWYGLYDINHIICNPFYLNLRSILITHLLSRHTNVRSNKNRNKNKYFSELEKK